MEEQIQRYCLKVIKNIIKIFIIIIFIIIFYLIYFINFKSININNNLDIGKGYSLNKISKIVLKDHNNIEILIYEIYLKLWNKYFNNINYGEFFIKEGSTLLAITKVISKPSNVFYKLTIVDGWQQYQLNKLIQKKFNKNFEINYNHILADTYKYNSTDSLENIVKLMKKNKDDFFKEHVKNSLFEKFSIDEILIISSLVEREGINDQDKKIISSVIQNRLDQKMKLQIDASTIFAITKGKFKLNRKLLYNDLKIKDSYNTYFIYGLPPGPISYVGRKTIEIVLENYKSEYLFYFFDENLNKNIFSKNYNDHLTKLNKYRNEK